MLAYTLITGATSDIGAAIAKKIAPSQKLIISGRNFEQLKLLKTQLENSGDHLIWVCDLNGENLNAELSRFLNEKEIAISNFIHAAGLFKIAPVRLYKRPDIDTLFRVNVLSAIELIGLLSKKKYRTHLKSIWLISSISALRGKPGYSVYAAAKSALSGLVKTLALELKPVRVNSLVLGAIKTEATNAILLPKEEELNEHIPLGLGEPETVANWMCFLLTNNNWMTGQEIIIDGGATAL